MRLMNLLMRHTASLTVLLTHVHQGSYVRCSQSSVADHHVLEDVFVEVCLDTCTCSLALLLIPALPSIYFFLQPQTQFDLHFPCMLHLLWQEAPTVLSLLTSCVHVVASKIDRVMRMRS